MIGNSFQDSEIGPPSWSPIRLARTVDSIYEIYKTEREFRRDIWSAQPLGEGARSRQTNLLGVEQQREELPPMAWPLGMTGTPSSRG